ncbi:hypothetical protein ACFL2G_04300 [Candidatus Omnitrophota bacterium]
MKFKKYYNMDKIVLLVTGALFLLDTANIAILYSAPDFNLRPQLAFSLEEEIDPLMKRVIARTGVPAIVQIEIPPFSIEPPSTDKATEEQITNMNPTVLKGIAEAIREKKAPFVALDLGKLIYMDRMVVYGIVRNILAEIKKNLNNEIESVYVGTSPFKLGSEECLNEIFKEEEKQQGFSTRIEFKTRFEGNYLEELVTITAQPSLPAVIQEINRETERLNPSMIKNVTKAIKEGKLIALKLKNLAKMDKEMAYMVLHDIFNRIGKNLNDQFENKNVFVELGATELLKHAFLAGNRADLLHPIYFYVELNADKKQVKTMRIFDVASVYMPQYLDAVRSLMEKELSIENIVDSIRSEISEKVYYSTSHLYVKDEDFSKKKLVGTETTLSLDKLSSDLDSLFTVGISEKINIQRVDL